MESNPSNSRKSTLHLFFWCVTHARKCRLLESLVFSLTQLRKLQQGTQYFTKSLFIFFNFACWVIVYSCINFNFFKFNTNIMSEVNQSLLDEDVKKLTIQDSKIETGQKRKPANPPGLLQKVFANPIVRIVSLFIVIRFSNLCLLWILQFVGKLFNGLIIKFVCLMCRFETRSYLSAA